MSYRKDSKSHRRSALLGLLSGTLLLSSCAGSSVQPASPSEPSQATVTRHVQATVDCPDGGAVTPKQGVPLQPLTPVSKLPTGTSIHLDFKAHDGGAPAADKVYFTPNTPFEVRFVQGTDFAVLDGDASDGLAVVQLPAGTYDGYVGTSGKPGGSLGIQDPIYIEGGSWSSSTGKGDWASLGLRQLPLDSTYGLGDYRLRFDPQKVNQFSARWFNVTGSGVVPPLPPLPPKITQLSGPDQVPPGGTGTVTATVSDANGDALTYHWTTTTPDGTVVSGNPANGQWTAPLPAGTYMVDLSVEDGYFTTTACQSLPIVVPNVCPEASLTASSTMVNAGQPVTLTGKATDGNGDTVSWSWSATGGSFSPTTGANTTWTAPTAAGTYTVTGTATDGTCPVKVSQTVTVVAPSPTPTPTPTPVPSPSSNVYSQGTKVRVGLHAPTSGPAVITEDFDLSGLPKTSGMMHIGYFQPATNYGYQYDTDNNNRTVGFSWPYMYFGTPSFYSYSATPISTFFVFGGSLKDGTRNDLGIFSSVGVVGGSAVLLDGNNNPLPTSRSTISATPWPAGTLIGQLKMVHAVLKSTSVSNPTRTYKLYFSDGSFGMSDSYNYGTVTGSITGASSKGSVVMPIGARFKCVTSDNANVYADNAFTPVKPPVISRHW
jgi:hypothetical protein